MPLIPVKRALKGVPPEGDEIFEKALISFRILRQGFIKNNPKQNYQ